MLLSIVILACSKTGSVVPNRAGISFNSLQPSLKATPKQPRVIPAKRQIFQPGDKNKQIPDTCFSVLLVRIHRLIVLVEHVWALVEEENVLPQDTPQASSPGTEFLTKSP